MKQTNIKLVSAEWDCKSEKSEIFRLLNMIHAMCAENPSFELKSTATWNDYVMTTWTNNIVDVEAVTHKELGEAVNHKYSMFEAVK